MIGFDAINSELLQSHQSQKLHHAILLHGKKGIGKASFAKKFAQRILQNNQDINPDLLIIEKEEKKKEITVNKAREVINFLNKTSAASPYKFIIIDSACELNKSSANAVLKVLEEPHANNFLILIAHNLNRVLPTIRSRCQIIQAPNLSITDFNQILEQQNLQFPENDLRFLSEICDNSPAEVINSGLDLIRFYELFLRSICNNKIGDELLKQISNKEFKFTILEKSFEFLITRLVKQLHGAKIDHYFDEEKVFLRLSKKFSTQKLLSISESNLSLLRKTVPISLDKKLSFINIFNKLYV